MTIDRWMAQIAGKTAEEEAEIFNELPDGEIYRTHGDVVIEEKKSEPPTPGPLGDSIQNEWKYITKCKALAARSTNP